MPDNRGMKNALQNISSTASKLGIPAEWLKTQAIAGSIPCLRIKSRFLFNVEAVELRLLEMAAETPKINGGDDVR
jgi:hypothetical protein